MAQYQSIPAATHQANAEPEEDTVQIHKSMMVRRSVAGAVLLILCVGFGVVATTQTSRSSRSSILAGTPPAVSSTPAAAAAALLRATTTTVSAEGPSDVDDYVGWLSELTCQLTYSDGIDKVQIDCWKKLPPNSPCNPRNGGDFYFEYAEYTSRNEGYVDNKIAPFERHYYVTLLMNKNKHHTVKLGKTEHRSITITAMRFSGARAYYWETTEIPNSAFDRAQVHLKYIPARCVMDCNVKYGFSWCISLQRCTRPSDTEWSQPSDTGCPDTVPVTTP